MIKKYTINMLNETSVTVVTQNYVVAGEDEYPIGEEHWKAYVNSTNGRQQVKNEVPEPYASVIFMMWGDSPTILED